MDMAARSLAPRRLMLASDFMDRDHLAGILRNESEIESVAVRELPAEPPPGLSGVVVDIDLTSVEDVQHVRRVLTGPAYRALPRLFVLSDGLYHGTTQAWALGATDTIQRPFEPAAILHRIRSAFPAPGDDTADDAAEALAQGVAAAQVALVKMFERLPQGRPLTIDDVMQAENAILKALKRSSLRDWLLAIGRHHRRSYRHTLAVTGYAVAFAQDLDMRNDDQRRLARAALVHDIGKAFVPSAILDREDELTEEEAAIMASHVRLGYAALKQQGGFAAEVLDVVLHHHEMLDGTGYPDALTGERISDIVRIITLIDSYVTLTDTARGRLSPEHALAAMEAMDGKFDTALLHAFRKVALRV